MQSLTSNIAIVTGGSRGLGLDIAIKLAAQGCDLVIGYHGRTEMAEAVVRDIEKLGRAAIAVRGDVAIDTGQERAARTVGNAAGHRFGRGFSGWCARRLDQRAGGAREWRFCLKRQ
jgi:3-oxoacyl-[acyl-carrier protein] reductase